MLSIVKKLQNDAEEIKKLVTQLILEHSVIERWNNNEMNNGVVFLMGDFRWKELSADGKQLQSRILEKYKMFYSVMDFLLIDNLPESSIKKLNDNNESFISVIEPKSTLWSGSKGNYLNQALEAIDTEITLLEGLYDSFIGKTLYIPDTNALLTNPDIENWAFDETSIFTIVILPTVLSELDKLKVMGHTDILKDKAKKIVRKLKEYQRRGDIFKGVSLAHKNQICAIAIEPNFKKTLPWLDSTNNDDRIIALYFEVVKKHPNSNVVLVTADINMQTKLNFAGAVFAEPPELEE